MVDNKYCKKDPAGSYQQKIADLTDPDKPKPVMFDPQEYLKLMVDNHGISGNTFSRCVLGRKTDVVREIFRSNAMRLPIEVAASLAEHSLDPLHQAPIYWLRHEYPVSDVRELPKLDITREQERGDWKKVIKLNGGRSNRSI